MTNVHYKKKNIKGGNNKENQPLKKYYCYKSPAPLDKRRRSS